MFRLVLPLGTAPFILALNPFVFLVLAAFTSARLGIAGVHLDPFPTVDALNEFGFPDLDMFF